MSKGARAGPPRLAGLAAIAAAEKLWFHVDGAFGALAMMRPELVVDTQESGIAVPSSTVLDGRLAIRVNLTNHRTTMADLHRLLAFVRSRGAELANRPGERGDSEAG